MEYGPFDTNDRADENTHQQNEIFISLQGYFMNIVAIQEEVERLSKSPPRGMNITDAQWSRFTNPLSQLEQPVKDFCALLKLHTRYPPPLLVVEQQRYSLLSILNDIKGITEYLRNFPHEYAIFKRTNGKQDIIAKQDEIPGQLERLKSDLKEFDQLLRDVFEQPTAQNQKDAEVVDNVARQPETALHQTISYSLPSIAQKVKLFLQGTWSMRSSRWQPYPSKSRPTELETQDISGVPATSKTLPDSSLLRQILLETDAMEQRTICDALDFPFNELEGKSDAATGACLFDKLKKRNLLPELEVALRKQFSKRFRDP